MLKWLHEKNCKQQYRVFLLLLQAVIERMKNANYLAKSLACFDFAQPYKTLFGSYISFLRALVFFLCSVEGWLVQLEQCLDTRWFPDSIQPTI
jgi:hypothetical protein